MEPESSIQYRCHEWDIGPFNFEDLSELGPPLPHSWIAAAVQNGEHFDLLR
jgi:hypothetical protein